MDRKARFDRHVLDSQEGEVIFEKGHLVQVYRNDLAKSISSECKLAPMWSEPCRVVERILNSYTLESLDGQPLEGEYHTRQLREFKPREGTELAAQEKEAKARRRELEEVAALADTNEETEDDLEEEASEGNSEPE